MFDKKYIGLFRLLILRSSAVLLGLGLFTNLSFGQSSSNASSAWNVAGTWLFGAIPGAATNVTINNHIVTLDAAKSTTGTFTHASTGTLQMAGFNLNIGSLAGSGTMNSSSGTPTLTIGNSTSSYSGTISGSIILTKSTGGVLTLSGNNSYTGATSIGSGAVINIQNANALGGIGAGTTVASGAALELQNNITVGAEALSLTGTGIGTNGALRNISGANTYGGTITLGGATTIQSDAGTLTLSAVNAITGATQNLTIEGAGSGVISGTITTTSGTVTKNDAGNWTLSGANTYTGNTTINGGTISVTNATGLGTTAGTTDVNTGGTLDINGVSVAENISIEGTGDGGVGALTGTGTSTMPGTVAMTAASTIGGAGTLTVSGVVSGAFALTKDGAGTLILSGINTYTGATTITTGTLKLGIATGIPSASAVTNNATLDLATFSPSIGSLAGTGTVTSSSVGATDVLTVGGDNTNTTFDGIIQNGSATSVALTKTGTGTLILTGTNTYTGATNVSGGGVLNIQDNGALGGTGTGTTVASGAALEIQNNITVGAEALSLTGTGIGTNGALRNISGANTYGGTITLGGATTIQSDAGTLTLSAANAITGAAQNLTIEGAGSGVISGTITTTSGTVTKNDVGNWTLSGANTYTGTTTVNAGTISVANATGLGTTAGITDVNLGGTLDINGVSVAENINIEGTGDGGVGALTGTGTSTLSGTVAMTAASKIGGAGTLTVSGVVSGAFDLTKDGAGTLILSGANTFTGAVTVNNGVLNIQSNTALGTTAGGVTVSSGAALQLQGGITVGAEALNLSGTGDSDDGALRNISGTNTYNGAITLSSSSTIQSDAGTLTMTGGVTNAGNTLSLIGDGDMALSTAAISGTGGLKKAGRGVVTLSFVNTYTGTITVTAGTLKFGVANPFPATNDVVLGGGILSTGSGAGVGKAAGIGGTLGLTCDSYINFGTGGHTLGFDNSSAVAWTAGKKITITGWTGPFNGGVGTAGRLFVGSASTHLTVTQLSQIRFLNSVTKNYHTATQLASGEVVATSSTTAVNTCAASVPTSPTAGTCASTGTLLSSSNLSNSSGTYYYNSPTTLDITAWTISANTIINICSGGVLKISQWNAPPVGVTVTVNILSGGTLLLNTSISGGTVNVYGILKALTTIQVQNSSSVNIASGGLVDSYSFSWDFTGSSSSMRNEGSYFAASTQIQGASAQICMSNSACTHVVGTLTANNTNAIDVQAPGFLYLPSTTSPSTLNNIVTQNNQLTVCKGASNVGYCSNSASGCNDCQSVNKCSGCGGASEQNAWPNATENVIGAAGACSSVPAKCNTALPSSQVAYFKASKAENYVVINWGVISRSNITLYVIEKSTDGITWEELGKVSVESNDYSTFSMFDYAPSPGYNYYRLRGIERNNNEKIYGVDMVEMPTSLVSFSIYPNPSNGNFNVVVNGEFAQYDFEVTDIIGQSLGVFILKSGKNTINTIANSGVYIAKLKVGYDYITQKIVVQ